MSPDKRNPEGYPADPAKRGQEERLEELLGRLPQVKAPSSLRAEVMAELRATPPTLGMRFRRWWRGLGAWRVPIQLAPVAALVAVAVIGQGLLEQGPPRPGARGIGLPGEEITATEAEALGLGLEIAKIPEDLSPGLKPPRTDLASEDRLALSFEQPDAEEPAGPSLGTGRAGTALRSEAFASQAQAPPPPAPRAPSTDQEFGVRAPAAASPADRDEIDAPEPIEVALANSATEPARAPGQRPNVNEELERQRGVQERSAPEHAAPRTPEPSENARGLPAPEDRGSLIARSLNLPPPESQDEVESRVGEIAATRVQRVEREGSARFGRSTGSTAPASAMAIDGSGVSADEFRQLRDDQVAYTPVTPDRRAGEETGERLEADVSDAQTFMTALGTTVDDLGGRVIERRALSADRDVWQVDAEVPRWRLEELRRRVAALQDPRLMEALTLIEDDEERPTGSLTPRERQLVDVEIVVYEHPLENIP